MPRRDRLTTSLSLLTAMACFSLISPGQAQVVPDATLGGGNNSTVNVNGIRTDVNGGLRRGSSLFHSFDRFNIPTNLQVYFANPAGIRNIFSRVTGRDISNIDGVLGVAGMANLFFMNPNGIIFGPNARLDVSGSFFATTANTLEFPDNQRFAATGDRAVPLVEVNIPIGLQFGANPPAMLTNRGNLAVGAGQSLSLVGGSTTQTGSLTAPGGTVQVLGNQVALLEQSQIDVSSPTGGGTVLVGGDYRGSGAFVNAQSTFVSQESVIKADALTNGNGGRVIVWADGDTRFNGSISAQGGTQGGNGGFVEVSGKQQLGFQGRVTTQAPQGQPGKLLLDPANITIATGGTAAPIPPTGAGDFTIDPAALVAALDGGAIELQADVAITVSNALDASANANANILTFTTPNIFLNASITTNGAQVYGGAVTVGTPTVNLVSNNGDITFNSTVNSATGVGNSLDINAGTGNVTLSGAVGTGVGGALGTLNATGNAIALNSNLTAAQATLNAASTAQLGPTTVTGDLNLTTNGTITGNGAITVGGTTTLAADTGDITLTQPGNDFNTVQITSGNTVTLSDSNALNVGAATTTGNFQITTNGALNQTGVLNVGGTTTLAAGSGTASLTDTVDSAGDIQVTGNAVNLTAGANVTSTGGNITLNGATSVSNSGSVTASGRQVQVLGNAISLLGGSSIDVSGDPTGGTVLIGGFLNASNVFVPTASSTTILSTATVNADSANGVGGNVYVGATTGAFIFDNNITVDGTSPGIRQLPPDAISVNPNTFLNLDPSASSFNNITVIDGDGASLITNPILTTDPILAQLFNGTLFQNFQIPQTALEGTTPTVLSGFLTGQDVILTARNNITIEDLGTNQLTLTAPPAAGGSLQLAAGNTFAMTQSDTIAANGRSLAITTGTTTGAGTTTLTVGSINTANAAGRNISLTAQNGNINASGSIDASSPTALGGNIAVTADNGDITIQNATIASNSLNNTTSFPTIELESSQGSVTVNNTQIFANSPNNGLAGRIDIDARNIVRVTGSTFLADGQFGEIAIGTATRPDIIQIQTSTLAATNTFDTVLAGIPPVAGLVDLQADSLIEVTQSTLSSNASGNSAAGAVSLQTRSNSFGTITLTGSTLVSEAFDTGAAGAIFIENANLITLTGTRVSNIVVGGSGGLTLIDGGTIAIVGNSRVEADTTGQGTAGNIDITATATNPNLFTAALTINNSEVSASTSATGIAGTVFLTAESGDIAVNNRSQVATNSTFAGANAGAAGIVSLEALDGQVTINNSSIASTVVDGEGDNINITAGAIALQNGAVVNASTRGAGNAGSIELTATAPNPTPTTAALTINNSSVTANTSPNNRAAPGTFNQGNAGTIALTTPTGDIAIQNNSTVSSSTAGRSNTPGSGNGGTVEISSENLSLLDGSVVQARSAGTGAPGSIDINTANTITIAGTNTSGQVSEISTFSGTDADLSNPNAGGIRINEADSPVGNLTLSERGRINASTQSNNSNFTGGRIVVFADQLTLTSGGQISASSLNSRSSGQAQAGNIDITVSDRIDISGARPAFANDPAFSAALSLRRIGTVQENGTQLSTDGGEPVSAIAAAFGIAATDPLLTGATDGSAIQLSAPGDTLRQLAFNWSFTTGESPGTGFNDTSFVSTNNSPLTRLADADGNPTAVNPVTQTVGAGNVVNIGVFNVTDTAINSTLQLSGLTVDGNPAQVLVNAPDLDPTQPFTSGIFARASGAGNAGSVTIAGTSANTQIALSDGAQISTSTETGGRTAPSNITLTGLNRLTATTNSEISASTSAGVAGDIRLTVTQGTNPAINLSGNSTLAATANAGGDAGLINLTAPSLNLTSEAAIAVSSLNGTGIAGDITINATTVNLTAANISAETDAGGASSPANINFQGLSTLQLDGARISAVTQTGRAGNLSVNAGNAIALNNSALSVEATGTTGDSGNVNLTTPALTVTNSRISAATVGGVGGDISLQGLNTLQLNNGQVRASTQTGQAGNVSVTASQAIALNNSALSVEATDTTGDSGNVNLTTPDLTVTNSRILASTVGGVGGDISLQGLNTLQLNNGQVRASTQTGQAGNVSVTASQAIALNNSALSVEATDTTGDSGNVNLTTPDLTVTNSRISASTVGGVGGDVSLQGLQSLTLENGQVTASTQDGQAGNLSVTVNGDINLNNGSRLAVEADGANGIAGDVTVQGRGINLQANSEISSSARGAGAIAGNVTLNGRQVRVTSSIIKASSLEGPAGEIIITADRLDLNRGELLAEVGQNDPGRTSGITLSVNNRLNLENESRISTLGRNGADGGDITILKVRFLFGTPPTGANGSDIVGRADGGGQGGRVFLDRATLVQGFLFRRAEDGNRTNDIDTNGQLDNFSTDADVGARGLSTSLIVFNDVSQIVGSACEAAGIKPTGGNAELRVTGRGGVPSSPTAVLPAQPTTSDWVTLELNPQVPVSMTLPNGSTALLKPGEIYQLQATCVNGWKLRQRSLL